MLSIREGSRSANDRGTGTPDRDPASGLVSGTGVAGIEPSGALRDALERLRLDGAIFFRAEFTEPWTYDSPLTKIALVIRPGVERLIFFHIIAVERCWVALDDGERFWANHGDIIPMPYGDDYSTGGVEPAALVPILTLVSSPPWEHMPVVSHGAGGSRTHLVQLPPLR